MKEQKKKGVEEGKGEICRTNLHVYILYMYIIVALKRENEEKASEPNVRRYARKARFAPNRGNEIGF